MARTIDIKLEFKWDGSNWTDETVYFMSATGAHEFTPPGEAFQVSRQIIQQCTIIMSNKALRFSIENTASPITTYIADGALYQTQCRIQANINAAGLENVFVGYIKLPQYDYVKNTVTFTVWDIGEILKQKFSCAMLRDYLEHEVVIYYLELAGLTDGVDFVSPAYAAANPGTPATIEYSTTPIPFSWLDDEPIWSELVDLAQSSGSRVFVDRDGVVHYERVALWVLPYGYSPETISYDDMGAFTPEYDDRSFFDAVLVEYTERIPGPAGEVLWQLTKPKVIQPSQTENIICRFKYPAISVDSPVANDTYYLTDIAGNDVTGTVTATITPTYAQQATMNITNSLGYAIVLSQATITGQGIHGQPSEQFESVSAGDTYNRRIDIRGNPYLQSRLQAENAAQFTTWWYEALKAQYKVNNVPGTPTREIGKRVDLQWVDNVNDTTHTETCIVTRIDWSISILKNQAIQYTQNLTCVEDRFDDTDYFILGTSTLSGSHVLWY